MKEREPQMSEQTPRQMPLPEPDREGRLGESVYKAHEIPHPDLNPPQKLVTFDEPEIDGDTTKPMLPVPEESEEVSKDTPTVRPDDDEIRENHEDDENMYKRW